MKWAYSPKRDHAPDPGEVVWGWVSYEEDASVGKDRPMLIIGHAGKGTMAALLLSSQNHQGDSRWILLGAGPWDREGRRSWLRLDRVLAVPAQSVRREGAAIPSKEFTGIRKAAQPYIKAKVSIVRRLLRIVRR